MGEVIQWAEAVEALKVIAEQQKLVSGMTVPEAAAALGFTTTTSGIYLKTVLSTAATSVTGATASSVATGAATGAATTTAVNLTLVEGAGGAAQVAGIGSLALPVAAVLASAAGGYLLGTELNKNPTFSFYADAVIYTTFDFITGQNTAPGKLAEALTPTVPMIYDGDGNAYIEAELINRAKNYLDSLGIGEAVPSMIPDPSIVELAPNDYATFQYGTIVYNESSTYVQYMLISADKPFIRKNNKLTYTVGTRYRTAASYTGVGGGGLKWRFDDPDPSKIQTATVELSHNPVLVEYGFPGDKIAFANYDIIDVDANTVFYGSYGQTPIPSIERVVTKYALPIPSIEDMINAGDKPWRRISLPATPPTELPEGEPVPESGPAPDPARITPYIRPYQPQPAGVPVRIPSTTPTNPIKLPNPEPDVSTAPYPAPNPTIDPSQIADPLPDFDPEIPLPGPIDTGVPPISLVPSAPSPSSAKGLLHVYNPTSAQVDLFGEWLWTTFSGDLIDTIGKLFNNPMDAVIGLHELYCNPTVSETEINIRAGFLESTVASRLVTSRYKEIKCGALSVPEYWGNYLDYSPYTKSYCYLPFIGIVELNTDDIVGSGVEITYRIDTYNGSCIALITTAKENSDESVTYQFDGNCSVSVPITSGMMTAVQNALIGVATTALSAGATAAVTVATGGTALPATVLAGSVAAGASKQGLTSKNMVQHSGSFGSSFGAMGIKIPFLIIKRPRQKVVHGYNTNYGYPAHKMVLLSTCSGYLKAKEVDVISSTATEAEKKMIEEILKSGVFVD